MSTDFIDRDLIASAAPRTAPAASPRASRAPADHQAELDSLREREAALEAEREAITLLQSKQTVYSDLRDSLEASLSASLERIGNVHVTLSTVLQIAEDSEAALHDIDARLAAIQEDQWPEDALEASLDSATETLTGLRDDYNRVAARLQDAASAVAELGLSPDSSPHGFRARWAAFADRARAGWSWALGAALPILAVALLISLAWWLFLAWWW